MEPVYADAGRNDDSHSLGDKGDGRVGVLESRMGP